MFRLKPMREEIEYDPPSQSEIVFPSPTAMRHVKHKLKKKKESPQFHRRKYSMDIPQSQHFFHTFTAIVFSPFAVWQTIDLLIHLFV